MDRLAGEPGIIGFRLFSVGGPRDPFAPIKVEEFATYRIWEARRREGLCHLALPPSRRCPPDPLPAGAFPQVRVVLNHLGICPGAGKSYRDEKGRPRIATPSYNPAYHTTYRLNRYENVVVKLSGQPAFSQEDYPYRDLTRWHQNLFDAYGPGRLMWGTDFPWNLADPGYQRLIGVVRELLPDLAASDHAAIMGATASRFLRFPGVRERIVALATGARSSASAEASPRPIGGSGLFSRLSLPPAVAVGRAAASAASMRGRLPFRTIRRILHLILPIGLPPR